MHIFSQNNKMRQSSFKKASTKCKTAGVSSDVNLIMFGLAFLKKGELTPKAAKLRLGIFLTIEDRVALIMQLSFSAEGSSFSL